MATLTPTKKILADIASAIAVQAPLLSRVATDFTSEPLKKGQTAVAHIAKRPTVQDYDYAHASGYGKDAVEANTLVEDREVTISAHKHVPIKVSYLQALQDQKEVYQAVIGESGAALGKAIVDDGLAKIVDANFSENTIETIANTDRDTLGKIRKAMNTVGAMTTGRTAIVNSDAFEALDADPRIASRDYYGQQTAGSALGLLRNVAGFEQVMEYPDLPGNSENLSGFAMDPRAMAIKTGLPNDIEAIRSSTGAPPTANFETITDPATGITLLGITWQQPGTFHVFMSVTLMWGWAVGSAGGADGAVADYAGHRLVTA
jgi:hypothetical protein